MKTTHFSLFVFLVLLTVALFIADVMFGEISVSFSDIFKVVSGTQENDILREIFLNFRLPKAITAVLAGVALSVSGLLLQTLFRNPLADPYILGVSSGASLGVSFVVLAASSLPFALASSGWSLVAAAIVGAVVVLFLVIMISFRVRNVVSLLIVGIMFGTISSALVIVLQTFSNPDTLKVYVIWTFGSLSAVSWTYMQALFPIIFVGTVLALALQKRLDGLLLGENYAQTLGIPIKQTRLFVVAVTGLLAGGITAFTGPIAFVGIAIPHIARGVFRTSTHRTLLPATMLCGASLLLVCDIISQIPAYALPINTVTSLFGAPIIIYILVKGNTTK